MERHNPTFQLGEEENASLQTMSTEGNLQRMSTEEARIESLNDLSQYIVRSIVPCLRRMLSSSKLAKYAREEYATQIAELIAKLALRKSKIAFPIMPGQLSSELSYAIVRFPFAITEPKDLAFFVRFVRGCLRNHFSEGMIDIGNVSARDLMEQGKMQEFCGAIDKIEQANNQYPVDATHRREEQNSPYCTTYKAAGIIPPKENFPDNEESKSPDDNNQLGEIILSVDVSSNQKPTKPDGKSGNSPAI